MNKQFINPIIIYLKISQDAKKCENKEINVIEQVLTIKRSISENKYISSDKEITEEVKEGKSIPHPIQKNLAVAGV